MTVVSEDIKNNINSALDHIRQKDYQSAKELVSNIYVQVKDNNLPEVISRCLSLNDFLNYSLGGIQEMSDIQDGSFMAEQSQDTTALLISELIKGSINFSEKNICPSSPIYFFYHSLK